MPTAAGFRLTAGAAWSIARTGNVAKGYEVELTRGGATLLVRSEPDTQPRALSDAMAAFATTTLAPRLAAIELRAHTQMRLGPRQVLLAKYDCALDAGEGRALPLVVSLTVLRQGGRRFFVAELMPESAAPALRASMEAVAETFDLVEPVRAVGRPRDPERVDGRRLVTVRDGGTGLSVRVPRSFRRRVRGRGARRVVTWSSPRGSVRLRVRAFDARSVDFDAHFRAYEKSAARHPGLRALKALPDAGGDVRLQGAVGQTRAYRARMRRQPFRVLTTLVHSVAAGRAYEVELAAHREQFVLREALLTRILASIHPTAHRPGPKAPPGRKRSSQSSAP